MSPAHSIHVYEISSYPHCSINAMNSVNAAAVILAHLLRYQILFEQATAIDFKIFVNAAQL